jgi:ribosomal protein L18
MNKEEPTTNEEYIAQVIKQAKTQEGELVPTHSEILQKFEKDKESYTQQLYITLGVIIVLIIAFIATKIFASEL